MHYLDSCSVAVLYLTHWVCGLSPVNQSSWSPVVLYVHSSCDCVVCDVAGPENWGERREHHGCLWCCVYTADVIVLCVMLQAQRSGENTENIKPLFTMDLSHPVSHCTHSCVTCLCVQGILLFCLFTLHGWEIAVILWNFRKTKLSKNKQKKIFKLYFNIHAMCNLTTFALRHMQISLSGILRHFRPPSRHLLLNTHDTNMEFLQLSGPLLDIFLFFSKTKIFYSHP